MKFGLIATVLCLLAWLGGCNRVDRNTWALKATNTLGTLECQTEAKMKRVVRAFDSAMQDLGYKKAAADVNGIEAVLNYDATGTKVTIKIKEFSTHTHIKVRVGLLGNETLSRKVLDRAYACL